MKSGTNLERVLAAGHFTVTGEIGPPKSFDAEVIRKKAPKEARIYSDEVYENILFDGSVHQSIAALPGMEERTIIVSGVSKTYSWSGDHQSFGNHPGAKNVHDIDSMQLVHMVQEMRDEGRFQCGEEIKGGGPPFFVGAAANPFAEPIDLRPHRLAKKAAAGADFIQTQLIYDMDMFRDYMRRVVDLGVHEKTAILAGVGPLKSSGMARYMRDKVPGMRVPDAIVERMEGAVAGIDKEDKAARQEAWRAAGIKLCIEQIAELREIEGIAGVHIMAIEWEAAIRPIVEGAGLLPRPAVGA